MSFIKNWLRSHTGVVYVKISQIKTRIIQSINYNKELKEFEKKLSRSKSKIVLHSGITEHINLGDFAQCFCISNWIDNYLSDYEHLEISAGAIVTKKKHFLKLLKKYYTSDLIFVFQSGYTTTDLGGKHDEMHRIIAKEFPKAKMLMMPQTILFVNKNNEDRTAKVLNSCPNLIFLSRDQVSYEKAKNMFTNLKVFLYPDIVTSLIGRYVYQNERNKIYLCCRNDGEKFYPDSELHFFSKKLEEILPIERGDTQSNVSINELRNHTKYYIEKEIEKYSKYKVTITDRYHGTIFSLCAGTPVIILRTTDHKVTTGADWFTDVYPGYVQVASNLDEAYELAKEIVESDFKYKQLDQYFNYTYYGKTLKDLISSDLI